MKRSIVHFELAADDVEKLADFYKSVFDWKIEKTGDAGMEYCMINTGEGEDGPNGGMMKKMTPSSDLDYFGVESGRLREEGHVERRTGRRGSRPYPGMVRGMPGPEGNAFAVGNGHRRRLATRAKQSTDMKPGAARTAFSLSPLSLSAYVPVVSLLHLPGVSLLTWI
jgi:catechol 2,3-dioxygenase-like lactoylglutathione lyase family enzyme